MIFQNNFDHFSKRRFHFKDGGSSGENYDPVYNDRIATIQESQQEIADKLFAFYESDYQPMEREQIAANRAMIPLETGLQKEKIAAESELLPGQVALTKAQNEASLSLIPGSTELAGAKMKDSLQAMKEFAPVRTKFFDESVNGVDINSRVKKAAADAAHSFMNSGKIMTRGAGRMGIDPTSGKFAAMMKEGNLDRTKSIIHAKGTARENAEQENFGRLTAAMNYRGTA